MSSCQLSTGNYQLPEGYKQTEVGVIPEDWDVQPVGKAFEIRNNLRFPISRSVRESMQGQYPYYGPTNVQNYINEYRVEGEHALIGEDGDHFLKWQEVSMTLLVNGKFNVNNHAHIIRGTNNLTIWFYYLFAHRDLTPHLKRQGAGRFKLNKATLIEIPCAIPPVPEQRSIAQALSDVDRLVAALEKAIDKKRAIKTATMQQLLTGKKRLPGFGEGKGDRQTEIGVIPEDWDLKTIGDVSSVSSGGTPSRTNDLYWNGIIPWITTTQIDFNTIDNSEQFITQDGLTNSAAKLFPPGTLLMAMYGQGKTRGKVAILGVEASTNQACAAISLGKSVHQNYVFHYLVSQYEVIRTLSNTGNQENLNGLIIKSVKIPLPPLKAEQQEIATVLSDMDTAIAALETRLAKTQALKQGMMQALLTGRIRLV